VAACSALAGPHLLTRQRWPATDDAARRAVASAVVPVSSRISLVMPKPQCVYLVTRRVGHGA